MKIKAKQYAVSLFESIQGGGQEQKEVKEIIKNFADILIANNDLSKTGEIIKYFNILWNKHEGITEAEIISAKKIDKNMVSDLEKFITDQTKSKKIVLQTKQDKSLLGGVILRYGDKSLNLSLRDKLNRFKKDLIN